MHIHGGDIYRNPVRLDYSANLNFLGMPASVREAACRGVAMSEHYPDVHCQELREGIAAKEGVSVEQVLCGNGAADLIYQLVLAEKPKHAVLAAPTFHEYEQALSTVNCQIHTVYLEEEEGFRYSERLLDALTEETDLLILCTPNNPTGQPLEPELRDRILARCREHNIRFLLDECFVDFLDDPEYYTSVPLLQDNPQLMVLKAFTKIYAMAGLRLGYALTADRALASAMRGVCQPWNVSIPAQMAGTAALKEDAYVEHFRELLKVERARLKNWLTDRGVRVYGSHANYIFFRWRKGLVEQLLERGIFIRDCSNYVGLEEGFYRIAVRSREENLQLLQELEHIIV